MSNTILLIDADSVAYRAAAAAEERIWDVYEGDKVVASAHYKKDAVELSKQLDVQNPLFKLRKEPEPVENAIHNVSTIIDGIIKDIKPSMYLLYLSSSYNYRYSIATIKPYKGNRDKLEKPYHLEACRGYMISAYGASVAEGYEADDHVSMDARVMQGGNDRVIICSIDKDLDNVPGEHYNFVTEQLYTVTNEEARVHFLIQLLTGDTVDNIAGVPGVGKAKAKKILDTDRPECAVGLQYALKYDDPEAAMLENCRLLWMSKEKPDDFEWSHLSSFA